MSRVKRSGIYAAVAVLALAVSSAGAAIVMKMGMGDLVDNADKVFRGKVIAKEPGTVQGGGGTMSTIVYTIEVEDRIKGQFGDSSRYQMSVLGNMKGRSSELAPGEQQLVPYNVSPEMQVGESYVLFTTAPSRIGLSTTVGLEQGLFRLVPGAAGDVTVVNGDGNRGLFDGPVSYDVLKNAVRQELN